MANEITITSAIACTKGLSVESFNPGQIKADQATLGAHAPTTLVSTSDTVIDFGTLTQPGWVEFRNLDSTNYVTLGPTSGGAIVAAIRLKAGMTAGPFFISPASVWRWQANTAAVQVKMLALET